MENTFRFDSISDFHAFCSLPKPEHPLISLVDYSQVHYPINESKFKWIQNFYSIGLKRNVNARFNYGQQAYDFDSGVLTFIAPMQVLQIEVNQNVTVEPSGWMLLIHPDFLWNTSLAKKIKSYEFFQYATHEALFLSDKEETVIVDILQNMKKEYQSNIDKYSRDIIVAQLETLLMYSERFYERQFITREKSGSELLERFEKVISEYFESGQLLDKGIPTVAFVAERLNISPNYLGTLLRMHTQQNTQQHIQNRLVDHAKERLSTTTFSVSEIAYELGFEHSQSFSKLFKKKTNMSPLAFRKLYN